MPYLVALRGTTLATLTTLASVGGAVTADVTGLAASVARLGTAVLGALRAVTADVTLVAAVVATMCISKRPSGKRNMGTRLTT